MDNIKVIVLKTKNYKYFIGFSTNSEQWIKDWISKRSQYTNLIEITKTHFTVDLVNSLENDINHFYITSIRDNEEFWVSLNNNCMGFNDNH